MKKIVNFLMIASLGIFLMSACSKSHSCPTYATSGPSKTTKMKKKNGISAGNTKKVKKLSKGKPMSGL